MARTADFIVIGSGIAGTSVAYELLTHGSVVVLEQVSKEDAAKELDVDVQILENIMRIPMRAERQSSGVSSLSPAR